MLCYDFIRKKINSSSSYTSQPSTPKSKKPATHGTAASFNFVEFDELARNLIVCDRASNEIVQFDRRQTGLSAAVLQS